MTWVVIGLVLAIVSGVVFVPYALFFRPWRVKRFAYFLMDRSPWYRSWVVRLVLRRMARSMRRITASLATVGPAMREATLAQRQFTAVYKAAFGG